MKKKELETVVGAEEGWMGEGEEPSDEDVAVCEAEETDEFAMKVIAGFRPVVIQDHRSSADVAGSGYQIATACKDLKGARRFFEWLISPVSLKQFYAEFWERKPLVIQRRKCRDYYQGWLSKADVADLVESRQLAYGTNIDVTNYEGGARRTLNGEGVANPAEVWSNYAAGCSIRLLHPQRWVDPLWLLLATLEAHFNCVVGCNTYLTPPGAQGFSPHYDDIEAFILQTEGKKRWRLYAPRGSPEVLPRFSSPNFSQHEVGEAVADLVLEAGDFLYMPRGTIHQAVSAADTHSLHVTVSTGQRNSWADFLEMGIPRAIQLACEDHACLRESLPRDFFVSMGVTKSDADGDPKRSAILTRLTEAMEVVFQSGPWDSAADQVAINFLRGRLPLYPSIRGGAQTAKGGGGVAVGVGVGAGVRLKTLVRLVFPGVARLAVEEGGAVLYHMMDNSREMHSEALWGLVEGGGEGEGEVGGEGEEGGENGSRGEEGGGKRKGGEGEAGKESKRARGENGESCGFGGEGVVEKGRLEFGIEYAEALENICDAFPRGLEVHSIQLESKKERLQLAQQLVQIGVLVVES